MNRAFVLIGGSLLLIGATWLVAMTPDSANGAILAWLGVIALIGVGLYAARRWP